jgi:hypothetical protein
MKFGMRRSRVRPDLDRRGGFYEVKRQGCEEEISPLSDFESRITDPEI